MGAFVNQITIVMLSCPTKPQVSQGPWPTQQRAVCHVVHYIAWLHRCKQHPNPLTSSTVQTVPDPAATIIIDYMPSTQWHRRKSAAASCAFITSKNLSVHHDATLPDLPMVNIRTFLALQPMWLARRSRSRPMYSLSCDVTRSRVAPSRCTSSVTGVPRQARLWAGTGGMVLSCMTYMQCNVVGERKKEKKRETQFSDSGSTKVHVQAADHGRRATGSTARPRDTIPPGCEVNASHCWLWLWVCCSCVLN